MFLHGNSMTLLVLFSWRLWLIKDESEARAVWLRSKTSCRDVKYCCTVCLYVSGWDQLELKAVNSGSKLKYAFNSNWAQPWCVCGTVPDRHTTYLLHGVLCVKGLWQWGLGESGRERNIINYYIISLFYHRGSRPVQKAYNIKALLNNKAYNILWLPLIGIPTELAQLIVLRKHWVGPERLDKSGIFLCLMRYIFLCTLFVFREGFLYVN